MDLSTIDDEELMNRLETLLKKLDSVVRDVAPKLTMIGNMREEISIIYSELKKRGLGEYDSV
ncbi:MAG: hypothetical protein WC895_04300 [Candidatus Shapirobacteria bacterium]|jgi:hypothetical protein